MHRERRDTRIAMNERERERENASEKIVDIFIERERIRESQ